MFNLRPILLVNGLLLLVLALAMLIPAALDFSESNEDWKIFVTSSFLTAFVGGSFYFSNRGYKGHLTIRQTFLFTTSSWFVLPAFAALPFQFSALNLDFTDAYFESVSGLTTTGSTVISGLDSLGSGILLWRHILQALGAVGVIVLAMAVLPMLRIGGMQLFRTESSDKMDKILPRAGQIAKVIGLTYVTLVVICAASYWAFGMSGFDAICHAISTLGTGGFSTHDKSIAYFDSAAIEIITIVAMLAGSLPMILYFQAIRGRPDLLWNDAQVRWFFGIVTVSILLTTTWHVMTNEISFVHALREVSFNITSVITTTGYVSVNYDNWGTASSVLIFMLLVVGGCTGSTTGGIKIFRFLVLSETAKIQLYQLIQPSGVFLPRYNGKPISESVIAAVLSFFTLFAFCFMIIAILLSTYGLDFITSMSATAQAMGNVGPGLGEIIGPASNFQFLPNGAKWLLSIAMIFGRLELFTVLVLFTVRFWRD